MFGSRYGPHVPLKVEVTHGAPEPDELGAGTGGELDDELADALGGGLDDKGPWLGERGDGLGDGRARCATQWTGTVLAGHFRAVAIDTRMSFPDARQA
jgi:hypothetical protein